MSRPLHATESSPPSKTIRDFFASSKPNTSDAKLQKSNALTANYDHSILNSLSSLKDESKRGNKKRPAKTSLAPLSPPKKQKRSDPEERQWSLDLGQKDTEECAECGMLYSKSSELDRESHRVFHRLKLGGVKIKVTGSTNVVYTNPQDSTRQVVLLSRRDESKSGVKELLETVDRELHLDSAGSSAPKSEQIYVYLANGMGVGVIRTEAITKAHRLLEPIATPACPSPPATQESKLDTSVSSVTTQASTTSDLVVCAKELEPAALGVSRVWVRSDFQRQGIATTLLDVARSNFNFGSIVPKASCAMTQPTKDGRQFATRYFGTACYLVYDHREAHERGDESPRRRHFSRDGERFS